MKLNWARPAVALVAWALLFGFVFPACGIENSLSENDAKELFQQTVHPLLQQKCFGCHGEDKDGIEGELDMTARIGLLKGGESGKPSLVPGKPDESPLFKAILREDEDFKMPTKDRNALSIEEIEIVRQLILASAPWPESPTNRQTKWEYKTRTSGRFCQ